MGSHGLAQKEARPTQHLPHPLARRHVEQRLDEQKKENAKLKQRNEALAAEVQDLKSGREAIEERARSELGLVKPDETFYQVVEPTADPKKSGDERH